MLDRLPVERRAVGGQEVLSRFRDHDVGWWECSRLCCGSVDRRSGRTTVAQLIARRHELRCYHANAHRGEHGDRTIAAGHPDATATRSCACAGTLLGLTRSGRTCSQSSRTSSSRFD